MKVRKKVKPGYLAGVLPGRWTVRLTPAVEVAGVVDVYECEVEWLGRSVPDTLPAVIRMDARRYRVISDWVLLHPECKDEGAAIEVDLELVGAQLRVHPSSRRVVAAR